MPPVRSDMPRTCPHIPRTHSLLLRPPFTNRGSSRDTSDTGTAITSHFCILRTAFSVISSGSPGPTPTPVNLPSATSVIPPVISFSSSQPFSALSQYHTTVLPSDCAPRESEDPHSPSSQAHRPPRKIRTAPICSSSPALFSR